MKEDLRGVSIPFPACKRNQTGSRGSNKRKILEFIEIVALSRFNDLVVTLDIHRTIPERRVKNQNRDILIKKLSLR